MFFYKNGVGVYIFLASAFGQKRSFTKSFIHWILVYKKDQYSKLINSMPLFDMDQLTSDTQMN